MRADDWLQSLNGHWVRIYIAGTGRRPPAEVAAEQARIDRVFANGWVFDFSQDAKRVKKLRHLRINLVGIGAAGGEPMNGTAAALSG